MKKLFLHCGTHKTGSTSIQKYLNSNMEFFSEKGFCLIQPPRKTGDFRMVYHDANCVEMAHTIIRSELKTPIRMRGLQKVALDYEDQLKVAKKFNADLHDQTGKALIVSGEAFSFLRTQKERAVFDIMFKGFDVRPIIFLREPFDWMESWKKQTAKLFQQFGAMENRKDSIFNYEMDSWLLDYKALAAFFQPNGRILSYGEELKNFGSVIPAFLRELGFSPDECPPWQDVWANKTDKSELQMNDVSTPSIGKRVFRTTTADDKTLVANPRHKFALYSESFGSRI